MKITRMFRFSTMLFLAIVLTSTNVFSQEEEKKDTKKESIEAVTRPADIGDASLDGFKNSSFDNYGASARMSNDLDAATVELSRLEKIDPKDRKKEEVDAFKTRLKMAGNEALKQQKETTELLASSKGMTESAKNLSPKTKIIKATKNTNESVKALNNAKVNTENNLQRIEEMNKRAAAL
ncbi:MAG TPA: hypothetical protein VD905_21980 [Flavobacteriales bacterium]|nr:hypothetical protein [Flavobacteriales bacterium]